MACVLPIRQGGRQHLTTLRTLADRLRLRQPACSANVMTLCQVAERILGRVERQPQSMHLASLFPMYLETIVGNLRRYATLVAEEHGPTTRHKSLMATEEMVRSTIAAFEQL